MAEETKEERLGRELEFSDRAAAVVTAVAAGTIGGLWFALPLVCKLRS